jgi:hypothetical protein
MLRLCVSALLVVLWAVPALAQPPAPATDVRINAPASDTTGPTVTITSPTSSTTYDNGTTSTIDLAGTASDARTITGCTWSNALTGGSGVVTGTTSWTVSAASLNVGSNAITVSCADIIGNLGNDVLTVTRAEEDTGDLPSLSRMGLPTPSFGLDQTVASVYGSETFSTHWIDSTFSGCTSSGNGTQSLPRCTIPSLASLAAGSVVHICGGPYTLTANLPISGTGTSVSPIFVTSVGCGDGPHVTINTNISRAISVTGSYIVFEGIKTINQQLRLFVGTSSDHISVRDNWLNGTGTSADEGEALGVAGTTHVVLARNLIQDFGDWTYASAENDTHCLGVSSNHSFTWYLWNEAFHCSGDGVGNGHDANHTTTDIYIGGNTFYLERENCVDLKEITRVIVTTNICHDIVGTVASAGTREAIVVHQGPTSQEGTVNALVMNNTIYTVGNGIASGDLRRTVNNKVWYVGNLIYDCSAGGQTGISLNTSGSPDTEHTFAHNTIADCPIGILVGSSIESLNQGGNIVSSSSSRHYQNDTSGTTGVTTVNRELFYQGGSNVAISWNATSVTYTTVAAWISGTGKGTGSLQSDPQFTNAAARDYSIPSSSPACGAGMDMSSIRTEISGIFGFDPLTYDIAGTARPTGSTRWAMGAYECP